jgi:hypothetical protein
VMHVASQASVNILQDPPPKNMNLMMLNILQTMQKNQEAKSKGISKF